MRLCVWALSMGDYDARSTTVNYRVLPSRPSSQYAHDLSRPIRRARRALHTFAIPPSGLPIERVTSIPVLVSTDFVGTEKCQTTLIFYASVEELIG